MICSPQKGVIEGSRWILTRDPVRWGFLIGRIPNRGYDVELQDSWTSYPFEYIQDGGRGRLKAPRRAMISETNMRLLFMPRDRPQVIAPHPC